MQTADGLFSADGLDHATRLLLEATEPPAGTGRILDLGCGWGPIATLLAVAAPRAETWAVDVVPQALDLTAANAARAGTTVRACRPDDVPAGLRFDAIWSNPPIRIGKTALRDLLRRWLDRLDADGVAHLVVGKHLGADSLHRWLDDEGYPTRRVASSRGFRVLDVGARLG